MEPNSKTVLIVDDIPYVRKTLKQILSQRGYRVVGEAEDGEEAVRLYEETSPDVVTMDLVMPIMNGVEATRAIMKKFPEARIVVLSAMMQENLVADAILAGAKDYIIKPFQTDEVLRVLNEAVGSPGQKMVEEGGAA
jgi:two-component system chemotaxis response regulator CheY